MVIDRFPGPWAHYLLSAVVVRIGNDDQRESFLHIPDFPIFVSGIELTIDCVDPVDSELHFAVGLVVYTSYYTYSWDQTFKCYLKLKFRLQIDNF